MAEVIVRQLIDDIDGSEIREGGGERVDFSFRRADYQIDLSAANIAKLEKALKRTSMRRRRFEVVVALAAQSSTAAASRHRSNWRRFVTGLVRMGTRSRIAGALNLRLSKHSTQRIADSRRP